MVSFRVLYSPAQVAHTLLEDGDQTSAAMILRATVVRDPNQVGCAEMLAEMVERDSGNFGERVSRPALVSISQAVVDDWIQNGMMIEALALLLTGFEGARLEWANLLGELLAPIPAGSHSDFAEVHDHLMRGAATLALTKLQDQKSDGKEMPPWAERRLSLLQWLLIENAPQAVRDSVVPDPSANELSILIREGIARRSFSALVIAVDDYAELHPNHERALSAQRALSTMLHHLTKADDTVPSNSATMPVTGPLAAMTQLRMLNFSMARKLLSRMRGVEAFASDDLIDAIDVIDSMNRQTVHEAQDESTPEAPSKQAARKLSSFDQDVVTRETDTRGLFRSLGDSSRTRKPMIDAATNVTDLSSLAHHMGEVEEPTRVVQLPEVDPHSHFADDDMTFPGGPPSAIQKLREAVGSSMAIDDPTYASESIDIHFDDTATLPMKDSTVSDYVRKTQRLEDSVVVRRILVVDER